jgi:hypothetical protein
MKNFCYTIYMKIGVLLYTYNRTDDAKINLEIIRNLWSKNDLLKNITIVHSFNGEKEWWPEKYLEDELLYLENPGHFAGAELLLNEGIKCFRDKYSDIDYVIVLASDTWLVKPEYIEKIILNMQKEKKYLATCPWGTLEKDNMWNIGMAIDFAVFDLKWSTKYEVFPIKYGEFLEKYFEVFAYKDETIYLERVLAVRFKQAIMKSIKLQSEQLLRKVSEEYIYRMTEREPVHDEKKWFGIKKGRKMYWPNIGLITHHEPEPKKEILRTLKIENGDNIKKLIKSKDLSYYNEGFRKNRFIKGNKEINYKE